MPKLLKLITNSKFSKNRKCRKCNKDRNHNGVSSNVWFCNDCRPNKVKKLKKGNLWN